MQGPPEPIIKRSGLAGCLPYATLIGAALFGLVAIFARADSEAELVWAIMVDIGVGAIISLQLFRLSCSKLGKWAALTLAVLIGTAFSAGVAYAQYSTLVGRIRAPLNSGVEDTKPMP